MRGGSLYPLALLEPLLAHADVTLQPFSVCQLWLMLRIVLKIMSRLTKGSLKSLFLHTQTHAPGNTKHRVPSASSSSSMVRGQNSWASLCSYGLHPLHCSPPRSSMQYLASSVTSRGLHFFFGSSFEPVKQL